MKDKLSKLSYFEENILGWSGDPKYCDRIAYLHLFKPVLLGKNYIFAFSWSLAFFSMENCKY